MTKLQYQNLIADIEAQIADSGPIDRSRLRAHLAAMKRRAATDGVRLYRPGARPEQDRIEEEIEAQFDNLPV
ncbi:hypothetical protein [Marinovum sp.]|uniref:hypothetical protein n=1 Tax=Marinovum sp. TaxID=2024839 RepID=UPI002B26618B|nr:hypothetical protein [Marinovum sp.]